jgi:NADH-quinone oxidoreductase subunit A
MNSSGADTLTLWPMLLYFLLAFILTAGMLLLSYFLGQHHREPQTGDFYEGGIQSTGSAHLRFSARFYLIAMFFVVFDLEAVFILAWAVAVREAGWPGFAEAVIFIVVLAAALVYLWRLGALDIRTQQERAGNTRLRKGVAFK